MKNMICVPMWIPALVWLMMGLAGYFNAVEKLYGGIRAGHKELGLDFAYHMGLAIMAGPLSLVISLNPWMPLHTGHPNARE
jgi:hypothetical protein